VVLPAWLLNEPHAEACDAPHVIDQEAPAFAVSFATSTVKVVCCPAASEVIGADVKAMVMDGAVMVTVTLLVADGLLVTEAMMVTVLPIGTYAGAA